MIQVDPNSQARTYILMIEPPRPGKRASRHITIHGLKPDEAAEIVSEAMRGEQIRRFGALAGRSGGATGGPPATGGEAEAMEDASPAGAGLATKRPAGRSGRTRR